MNLYFAPMEGITDAVFRGVHHACFSGIAKYYLPFVSPTESGVFTPKEQGEIDPARNAGYEAVPQVLTKQARHFLWCANALRDLGYTEVNLNLGCPSGTVTGKGKGSGMLLHPDTLRAFLDEVFAHSPLPVSIKTRIGYLSEEEWPALLSLYAEYPLHSLIIHPRTRREFYKGTVHTDAIAPTFEKLRAPIILNGDLFTPEDCRRIADRFPDHAALMLGRGLIANPALAQEMTGGEGITHDSLLRYHRMLCDAYASTGNDMLALARMRAVTFYMIPCFEDAHKAWKQIRKARTFAEYLEGAKRLFGEYELKARPYYSPEDE